MEHAISTGIATSNCKIKAVFLQASSCPPFSQWWQCYMGIVFFWVSELNQLNSHLTGTQYIQLKGNSKIGKPEAKKGSNSSPASNTELLPQLHLTLQCYSQTAWLSLWLKKRALWVSVVPRSSSMDSKNNAALTIHTVARVIKIRERRSCHEHKLAPPKQLSVSYKLAEGVFKYTNSEIKHISSWPLTKEQWVSWNNLHNARFAGTSSLSSMFLASPYALWLS